MKRGVALDNFELFTIFYGFNEPEDFFMVRGVTAGKLDKPGRSKGFGFIINVKKFGCLDLQKLNIDISKLFFFQVS